MGITSLESYGHTPVNTFFFIASKGARMVSWGDLVHFGAVKFAARRITAHFDVDEVKAAAARKVASKDTSLNNYWIAAPHLSFPWIGHLTMSRKEFIWLPANYSIFVSRQRR